jgi:hypothetical protein
MTPTIFKRINTGLAAASLALLISYVIQTNLLAAQTWNAGDAHDRLTAVLEQRNSLIAQEAELDDRSVLEVLAHQQGLVPAGTVAYIIQDTAVAAR